MIYSRKIKVQLLERTVLIRLTIDRQRNYLFVGLSRFIKLNIGPILERPLRNLPPPNVYAISRFYLIF